MTQSDSRSPQAKSTLRVAVSNLSDRSELEATLKQLGVVAESFADSAGDAGAVPLERWSAQLVAGEFSHVVFASAQGVRLVIEMEPEGERRDRMITALAKCVIVARGKMPAQALAEFGIHAHQVVKPPSVEGLLEALSSDDLVGKVVGIQPFDKAQEHQLASEIEARGGSARLVAPATTVDPEATRLLERILSEELGAVAFLSERAAAWMFDACRVSGQETRLVHALRTVFVLASEQATDLLRRRGVHPHLVMDHAAIISPNRDSIAEALGLTNTSKMHQNAAVGRERVVIVGNGMVGYKFCDRLTESGESKEKLSVVALGEEPLPAYDRVHLSEYFSGKTADDLLLEPAEWYKERGIDLRLNQKVSRIDRESRLVITQTGEEVPYDTLVLATGAGPFVPPIPGTEKKGVFVYRTIDDLNAITEYAKRCQSAAVIGGGLLGLEAAKAAKDLGLETHVVEMAPRLMPRQLDDAGAALLKREIESLGLTVHLGKRTTGIAGDEKVSAVCFADGDALAIDMIIISAGIKPRDSLAKEAGIKRYERGGIVVNNHLRTSDENIYAIGECAVHEGTLYGLVAPGYEMAGAAAQNILGNPTEFAGADMSTKLKLLGVDVASLGDAFADTERGATSVVYHDLLAKVYKKLIVDETGKKLIGAILVGDTKEYATLLPYAKSGDELPLSPDELLFGTRGEGGGVGLPMPDTAQICSCNNVTKLDIVQAIDVDPGCSVDSLKKCTKAGTGCGGCMPLVIDLFNAEMAARGQVVKKAICEHFDYSRQELFDLVRVGQIKTFEELLNKHGSGHGCEVCKPVAGSIFATTGTDPIIEHQMLQDTNDRFLANIQRKGLYSVVPRIPGGEITPEKLIAMGEVAKKYNLYTKVTGGQRIDLFGARVDQLPEIWEELIAAGFESGHAYAKSLRTVKSCVGSTWCRYGVGDSVGFAIRVENRYKGLRSPHKLKSGVSGCTRECAEAQGKDFGLIATEHGYNLYVCGNGGAKPRHADLLAADIDEDTAIKYLDRFIMYYIRTADKLQRTSVWLEKIEGGIDHVKNVVVNDSLGIAAQLEEDIQKLIDGYVCEWKDVVENPEKRNLFRHFAGEDKASPPVEMVSERGQGYPVAWPKAALTGKVRLPMAGISWQRLARVEDVPAEGGTAVKYGEVQLALFHFKSKGQWFATQNLCPHKREMVLARGLLGDAGGAPKVACPFHKKTFNLETGAGISDEELSIATFPVKVDEGWVYAELPSADALSESMKSQGCVEDCATAAE